MSDTAHEIQLALRTAAGHERAAREAEAEGNKKYEMKMISAGTSAYSAFTLAIKAAPEYQGRKIDDKAVLRIYQSNKPRPWWDKHLAAVKVEGKPANREWAKRVILWHVDLDAAKARRARRVLEDTTRRNRLKAECNSPRQGPRGPQPRTDVQVHADARRMTDGIRSAQPLAEHAKLVQPEVAWTTNDLLGEVNRISAAVRKVKEADRAAVLETLRVTAREIERYTS